jgi:cell division septation protein DedD
MTSKVHSTSTENRMMVDPIDDIARQARQGSVSAVIQILNEKLADSGIRTRAIFEQGVLQLLCEAPKPEQLDRPHLVPQVQQILNSLQPRNIRRVNINSRIVREQQLLWLDEINRDPEGQLLWSEEITLSQPSFFQRLVQDRKDEKNAPKANAPKGSPIRLAREKRVFWRGLLGGASLSLFLLLVGWALKTWLNPKFAAQPQIAASPSVSSVSPAAPAPAAVQPSAIAPAAPQPAQPTTQPATQPTAASPAAIEDSFTQAVRLAEDSARLGQSAKTSADWLDLAARWQRASDLMAEVPPTNKRFKIAQDRVQLYRNNSEAAAQKADSAQ